MSIFLGAVGAVLAFAVTVQVQGVDLQAVGWILMVVAGIGLIVSFLFFASWAPFSRRRTVIEEGPTSDLDFEERRRRSA